MRTLIPKIVGAILGLILITGTIFFQINQKKIENTPNPSSNSIGYIFDFNGIKGINTNANYLPEDTPKIVVFVSPNCPHCKNVLKILSNEMRGLNKRCPIIPIFSSSYSSIEIGEIIRAEKITYPVFQMNKNDVMNNVKAVPSFVYLDNSNEVKNEMIGGVRDYNEFRSFLFYLTGTYLWESREF